MLSRRQAAHGIQILGSVQQINWVALKDDKIEWIVFDIENTLEPIAPKGQSKLLRDQTIKLLLRIRDLGFKICFATNSLGDFSQMIRQLYDASFEPGEIQLVQPRHPTRPWKRKSPRKPQVAFYQKVLDRLGCQPEQAVMIGDKLLHDCIPAARLGLQAVWIKRLDRDLPLEFVRRWYESCRRRLWRLPKPVLTD